MTVRGKIIWAVSLIVIPAILATSFVFGYFYYRNILRQEQAQAISIENSVSTYVAELTAEYLGTVKDWAHWDDTLSFMNGEKADYIRDNINVGTFENLNINFMVFVESDGSVKAKYYYDHRLKKFTDFPFAVEEDLLSAVLRSKPEQDVSGLLKIGSDSCFVASTDITDDAMSEHTRLRLIIGRHIGKEILTSLSNITRCTAVIEDVAPNDSVTAVINGANTVQHLGTVKSSELMRLKLAAPDAYGSGSPVGLSMLVPRDTYQAGIVEMMRFSFLNFTILLLTCSLLFWLLGRHVASPLAKLIENVKEIDFKHIQTDQWKTGGGDEFSFLRGSIRKMLQAVEVEQLSVRESEELLYATLHSVGDAVITVGKSGDVQFMNPVAQRLTGWVQAEAVGQPIEAIFNIVDETTKVSVESPVMRVFETKEILQSTGSAVLITASGTEIPIEDTTAPIHDKHGDIIGCVLVFRDASEKKEKQKRIEYLSYHDQLTGLYNRRFFEEEIARIDSPRSLPVSFVYADLNGLKIINDAFGHSAGDALIRAAANVLLQECRAGEIICRTGGDEFIILLPNTDAVATEMMAVRLKERIEQTKAMDMNLSISLGWDTKTVFDQSIWDCLSTAEDMMYANKFVNVENKSNTVIRSILTALFQKSPQEEPHSQRVGLLSESIGRAYGLSESDVEMLRIAGELHDIGKIVVDESILNKPDKLSLSEWEHIKKHPEAGYRLLETSREFYGIAELVRSHHEMLNGTGYPRGITSDEIPWMAKAIAIADAYDAMTGERPYRVPLSQEDAIAEIRKCAGIQFDPVISKLFVEKVLSAKW